MFLVSKAQTKKNEMLITPCFYIAPICEATEIFLQIKKKSNYSTSNNISAKQVKCKHNYFCLLKKSRSIFNHTAN